MNFKFYLQGFLLVLLFSLFGNENAQASHAMGADLQYQCLGNNQYRITLRFYRDCEGISAPTSPTVQITAPGCAAAGTLNLNLTNNPLVSGTEVSQLCASQLAQSGCNYTGPGAPPYPGVKVHEYTGIITLPVGCNNWRVRFTESARNPSDNLVNAGGNNLSIEAVINNTIDPATGQSYCNNSSTFSSLPVPFVCANNPVTYNHGAVDADGDSLVYSLIYPLGNGYNPMTFAGGYSVNNPVQTNPANSFNFNSQTGQMNFVPAQQETDVLAIRVDEYRNGVLVGSVIRDIQISVMTCAISTPIAPQGIGSLVNGSFMPGTSGVDSTAIQVCPNTPVQFDIEFIDPANHNLTLTSTISATPSAVPGATFSQIGTGDTVRGRVTWTAQPSDTGCHNFIVTGKNDDCPINGSITKTYKVCVLNYVDVTASSPTFCGTPVQLTATGGSNFTWSPATGPNAVSNPNSLTPKVNPTTSTMYKFTSDCGTDSVVVNVAPPFTYDAGPGGSICQNGQLPLNGTVDNLYPPYSFKWVPSAGLLDPITGLPSDSVLDPVASPLTTTKYKLYVTGNNGCTNVDSLTVTVAGTGPVIVAKATPTDVCPNEPVQLNIVTNPQSCGISQTPCGGNTLQAQIGTGAGVTPVGSPTQYPTIYGHYSSSARHQFLYLASELLAQFPSGGEIRTISFKVAQINTPNDTMKNFTISMACTQAGSLTTWQPNLSQVFNPKSVAVGTTLGWRTYTLDAPYNWDGTSNLVIDVCFNNPPGTALNNKMEMTPTPFSSVYYSKGNSSQCGVTGIPASSPNRPNTQFTMCVEDISNLPIAWTPATGPNAPAPATNSVNPVAHPVSPTLYNVDVTSPNGCVSSDYVFVNVDTSLRFYAFPDDTFFCTPVPVTLTTSTVGSPLPGQSFQYQWTNLTTNQSAGTTPSITVTPSASTSYLVRLTGGACTQYDTVHVLLGTTIPVNLVVSQITCNGANNGRIKAVPVGGNPPLTFNWSNAAGNIDSIANLAPGTYSVTVTDAQSCAGSASATINNPPVLTVNVSTQNVSCFGGTNGSVTLTANGGTPPYSYNWNPANANQPAITGLPQGSYSATVTDFNGCSSTLSASISQPNQLNTGTLAYPATSFGGNEGWAYAFANGGTLPYAYTWSTGSTNDTIMNLVAGTYYVTVCDANGCCKPDSAVVTDPPPIILTFNTTNNPCFGNCLGTAHISAAGGIDPYTFAWSNGIAGDTVSNLCAGIYTVTVTDSAGVTVMGSINITQPTAITIVLDTTDITCFGANNGAVEAIASGGTPGYTYTWTPGGNTNPITALGPGTYDVLVRDANNCTSDASWTAVEPPQLTAVISTTGNVSCFGGTNGSATVVAAGGTVPYQYAWSMGGSTTPTGNGFNAGNHSVTVTDDNACVASATFTITEPLAIVTSVVVTNATCNGAADGAVDLTVSGGTAPYNYQWTGGYTTQDLTSVLAGTYEVTVTDSKICTADDAATVGEPTAITLVFNHNDPGCTGDSNGDVEVTASGGTPGYTYDWAYTSSGNDNSQLTGLPAGIYDVTVTDAATCTVQGRDTLTDPPSLNAFFTGKDEISCANAADGAITIVATGGTEPKQYNWNTGATTETISNVAPGAYNITVTDANGCDTTLNVMFTAPPAISLMQFDPRDATCPAYADGSIQISATGGTPSLQFGYEYSINNGPFQQSEFFQELTAGVYTIQVRDGEGCILDTSTIITEPAVPDLTVFPTDTLVPLGSAIVLASNITNYNTTDINGYTWSPVSGVECGDCASTLVAPYTHTDFTLTVNYLSNCSVSGTVRVFVGEGDDFFIPNAFSPNGDGNNDVLEVYGTGLATVKMKIFNRWGEKIFDSGNQWGGWDGTFKGELQNPGVYTYYVEGVYLNGKVREKRGTITILR